MRTKNRMDFIQSLNPAAGGHNQDYRQPNNQTALSKEDRLREISMTKVDGIQTFNALLEEAIKKQQQSKIVDIKTADKPKADVIKDDMFGDIDDQLGL